MVFEGRNLLQQKVGVKSMICPDQPAFTQHLQVSSKDWLQKIPKNHPKFGSNVWNPDVVSYACIPTTRQGKDDNATSLTLTCIIYHIQSMYIHNYKHKWRDVYYTYAKYVRICAVWIIYIYIYKYILYIHIGHTIQITNKIIRSESIKRKPTFRFGHHKIRCADVQ